MKLHKSFLILLLIIFFNFCSNENLNTEISLNDCIKNILSPTDYEKFLNNEITLEPYQELIDDCLAGNLEISSIANTEVKASESEIETEETTTTSTTEIKTNKSVVGFTTEATNASEKWPMIYKFENTSDISESHKIAKTSTTINSSRVENLQLVFNNCESNVINLETVDINQKQEIIIVNEDCRQGITINSFKHLILSNLNFEIKLFKNGKFENVTTGDSGCCHTLNIEELISNHTSYINTFFNTTTTTTTIPPSTTTTLPKFTNKELGFYIDSYSTNDGFNYADRFLRWQNENVSIAVQGYYSEYQLNILNNAVNSLNKNTPSVNFYLVNSTEGNIDFYFYDHSEWNKEYCTANSSYRRYGKYDFDSSANSISKSVLCILPEDNYKTLLPTASSSQLKDCIASDLYFLLGFAATGTRGNANNSTYGDNIFSMEYCNETTSYTSLDKRMFKLIYDDRVKNFKTRAEVVEFFSNN